MKFGRQIDADRGEPTTSISSRLNGTNNRGDERIRRTAGARIFGAVNSYTSEELIEGIGKRNVEQRGGRLQILINLGLEFQSIYRYTLQCIDTDK